MPAAPTLEALFDTQGIVETAFAAFFTVNGLNCYTSRSQQDMPDAHVSVAYEPGASQGNHQERAIVTNTGQPEQDWFTGNLTISTASETAKDADSPDSAITGLHNYRVARLRVLMLRGAMNGSIPGILALDIPYHRIVFQSFLGQQDSISENGFAQTDLGYSLQIAIAADAWPAA